MHSLLEIFIRIVVISLTSYSGSAQSLFYEVGVTNLHWITNQDYVSYLGFGFASPGPQVFSLATFMGYGKAGMAGGIVGTFAIYIMPVTLAILSGKYLKKWIQKERVQSFVSAVAIASAGLLAAIGVTILGANQLSAWYVCVAVASAVAVVKKISPLLIIVVGLLLGLLLG